MAKRNIFKAQKEFSKNLKKGDTNINYEESDDPSNEDEEESIVLK
jgi:hypothetical protein